MKSRKLNLGFTLLELMVTLGIVSALLLVVMNGKKLAINSAGDLKRNNEINNLIQLLTSELSREEVCTKNFFNKPVVRVSISSIVNKSGNPIINQNSPYGDELSILAIDSSIASSTPTGSVFSSAYKMNLTINYQPRAKTTEIIPPSKFFIPINVFLVNGFIKSCYSDIQSSLELAVQYACQGNGAKYYPPDGAYKYGRCEHEIEIKRADGSVITPVAGAFVCPAGQLLRNIDTSQNKMSFECGTIGPGNTITCPAWSYLRGIKTDGTADCVDVRTIFASSGFVVFRSGAFQIQNMSCDPNEILQSFNPDGSPHCVNPRLDYTCPVNKYVTGIDASGNAICSYSSNQNACAGGMHMISMDTLGNVTCDYGRLSSGCSAGQVMTGIDGSAAAICAPNPP